MSIVVLHGSNFLPSQRSYEFMTFGHWSTNGIEKRLQNGSPVHLNVMIDGHVSDVIVPVVRSP